MPENFVSRDGFSRPVPRQPAHLHIQAEYGAYEIPPGVPRRRPIMKPLYAIGSVPNLSGHANADRWRSLPRVHRHRAIKRQGSSELVVHRQVAMDQLICASFSHTHYWYEVAMLKVPMANTIGDFVVSHFQRIGCLALRDRPMRARICNQRTPEIERIRPPNVYCSLRAGG